MEVAVLTVAFFSTQQVVTWWAYDVEGLQRELCFNLWTDQPPAMNELEL
jgi:hypothetical protein